MQNVIKTNYYDLFVCIADKCPITCCQEWKISVDDETGSKWIERGFNKQIIKKDEINVIRLNKNKRCPFLNDTKLCKLVIENGDEFIPETCRIFPRQIHEFDNRKEYSLVSCCPEVVDILYRQDEITFTDELSKSGDSLLNVRNLLIDIIQRKEYSVTKGLMITYYVLLDIHEKVHINESKCYQSLKNGELEEYRKSSFIKHLSDEIDKMSFDRLDSFDEANELFLDLVYNYRKEDIYTSYLDDISFKAEQFEKRAKNFSEVEIIEEYKTFNKLICNYENLFRNYLVSEIFTNLLIPDTDLESMIVMLQWIAIEFAAIRHCIFLKWSDKQNETMDYNIVRDYIVIISRMTGYDQEDIFEYLENSFESLIWEWGYLALIVN